MNKALKDKALVLLPEMKNALKEAGEKENVNVGKTIITRTEAERIVAVLEREIKSKSKRNKIDWDLIPLKLVVSEEKWREFQQSLNEDELNLR